MRAEVPCALRLAHDRRTPRPAEAPCPKLGAEGWEARRVSALPAEAVHEPGSVHDAMRASRRLPDAKQRAREAGK